MSLDHFLSVRHLRLIGRVLFWDGVVFVGSLLFLLVGRFSNTDWLYYPIAFLFVVPLGLGWIVSAFHLWTSPGDEREKGQWWARLLFSGPIGAGWYLTSLKDD